MKTKTIKHILLPFLFLFFTNCISQKEQLFKNKDNEEFKAYLLSQKIPFKELTSSVFDTYYSGFLNYERKQRLEKNPYLKVNKVYVHYRTPTSVEFMVYSDKETFCVSTYDLDMDGKILSFPENGIVKVLKPIQIEDFGDFEITNNLIKTRKRYKSPFREWYQYLNGSIKNDTIHFTEKYLGTHPYKFKKKWLAKTRKSDIKEVYQPDLKAKKYKDWAGLTAYEITGQFNIPK